MNTRKARRWLREHRQDPYVKKAKTQGFRSRAAYKLAQMDERDKLFRHGAVVVDLGAAPGGWSQYAARCVGPKGWVVALDILPMQAIPGVRFICGDFRQAGAVKELSAALDGRGIDLVMSDMAPNMSGIEEADRARAFELCERALSFATQVLAPGGSFLVKAFQDPELDCIINRMRGGFGKVVTRKPGASRSRSREIYLIGQEYSV